MSHNPVLKKLGLSNTDRVVIFHSDDIGMCQATVTAYPDLLDFGLLSSAATMVPCPWFPAIAAYCRQQQDNVRIDMGVHLTLTSEWDNYRWGPISTSDTASGLIDQEGYFYRGSIDSQTQGSLQAVQQEIEAQLNRALTAGIDVTHLDTHMFAIFPQYMPVYVQLALEHKLPAFLLRYSKERLQSMGYDEAEASAFTQAVQEAEAQGIPALDDYYQLSLDQHEDRLAEATHVLDNLGPGITYFLSHPAQDSPELRAIAPDWRCRVADYELFLNQDFRDYVEKSRIQVINYGTLGHLMQEGS